MDVTKVMIKSIAGTAMMTGFSYLLSALARKDFREPALLGEMLRRKGVKEHIAAGWAVHVGAGLAWAPVLDALSRRIPAGAAGKIVVLGLFSGLTAVGIWRLVFALHPNPPANDRKAFYLQLIAAHWIFSLPYPAGRSPRLSPSRTPRADKP